MRDIALLARLAVALVFTMPFAVLSINLLADHARALPIFILSGRIEKGARIGPEIVDLPALPTLGTRVCLASASRARLTVALAALDETMRRADFAKADFWRQQSIEAAVDRLRCVPTDGNAWLQYALANLPASGPLPNVLAALDRAYLYAPREEWVMAVRLPVVMDLAWRAGLPYGDRAKQEFGEYIRLGRNIEVGLQNIFRYPAELKPVLLATMPEVTTERQRHLRYFLEERGYDLGIFGEKQEIRNPFSGDVLFHAPVPGR